MRSYARRTFGIAAALFLASCFGDSTGPAARRRVPLSIAPVFDSRDAAAVLFDKVRVHLVSQATQTLALDTVIDFPSSADSVVLALSVPVQGASETFDLSLVLFTSGGDTVFRGGPVAVDVLPGVLNAAPADIAMRYVGVGANAAGVRFAIGVLPVFFGDTATFSAEAYDSAQQPIPGTPVAYAVDARDSALAYVPNPDVGRVVARSVRGSARIVARLLTHQADTTGLSIQPRPSAVTLVSGGGQTMAVGGALAQPVVVRVTGSDGGPVVGVPVTFTATVGGGSFSPNPALTDGSGNASTTWTLGSLVGSQTMTASAGGVTSTGIGATGSPASASKLGFTVQPVSAVAGATLPAVSVAAQDAFGNLYTGFGGNVTLALGSNPGGATLSGTTTASTVAGIATFATLSLDKSGTGYTLVASTSGLTSATSSGFNILAGAAATLSLVSGDNQSGSMSTQLPLPVVVKVSDALGNGVSGRSVTFTPSAGGSVGTPSATTDALGLASTTWTLGTAAAESLTVASTGLTGSPLTVTARASGGVASTTVSPRLDTLTALTATVQLAAQAKDATGANVTGSFTWLSRSTGVATVSTAGLVTAVTNGSTWVVATEAGGTKDSAQIVVQQRVATVNVTPSARNIYLTRWYTFTAAAVDGKGYPVPGTPTFTWSSTAPAIASVDSTGLVTGVGLGAAQIRATTSGVTGVANVQIVTPITRIAVVVDTVGATKTDTFTLTSLGLTRTYKAIAHDTLDAVMTGVKFTWVSTNGSVAQLQSFTDTTATVVSAANGYTQVNATAQGFTSTPGASLTVSQVLAAIALTPASAGIAVGGSIGLTARGLDANGRYISGGTFTYTASNANATVGATTGQVTGVALGVDTITAASGTITSNYSIIVVNNSVPPAISFGRDTVSVGRGGSASIPVLLTTPVPVGGPSLTVNLGTNPTAYAHWSTSTVTIPQGGTSTNATLVGDSAGTTLVTASDGSGLGYAPDTAVAKVTANMALASSGYAINATDVATTQVRLSDPSPAGGTYVTFSYGTAGIASVSPDPAYIPAGQLAADIQIRGLAGGNTTITPVAIGVNGTASSFTAYAPVLTPSTTSIRLGQGQFEPNVYVTTPTNTILPVPVTLASSDSTVASVPASVTVPSGTYYVYFPVSGLNLGTATLTYASTGWTQAYGTSVTVTTPAVGVCCGNTNLFTTSPQQNISVYSEDSTRSSHERINALVVQLHSTDTTIVKVVDTTVTIQPGAYYASGRFVMGGLVGSAWIVATASGHAPDSAQYTVAGPPLSLSWGGSTELVGAGQYNTGQYVYTPTNVTAPLAVTLSSSDTTIATVQATVTIPQGSYYAYFTVTGLVAGNAIIRATAPGYNADSGNYRVTSPFLTACCDNGSLRTFGSTPALTVYSADSLRSTHFQTAPLTVSLVSTDTTVIKVDSSAVTIAAGTYYNSNARVIPVGVGTAKVIVSAAGHPALDTLTYTVSTPQITFSFATSVLGRRQHFDPNGNGFYVATPDYRATPLVATISHLNSRVDSLSTTSVTIPTNSYYAYLDAYGLSNGTDTLIVTAPGYLPDTAYLTVSTPRLNAGNLPGSLTTTNPPFNTIVYAADSAGTAHYTMDTVVVAAASSDSNVLRPKPVFRIPRNVYYAYDSVFVVGPGPVSIVFSDSAGTGYLPDTTNTVTVTGPSLSFSNSTPMLGMRQTGGSNSAYVQVPNNVTSALVVHLLSTDTRVVAVPDSVIIPTGTYYAYFPITALDTLGTIQVQASATGYGGAATNVQVTAPRFVLSTSTSAYTTTPARPITVYAADATGNIHYTTENVTVTLASSAPSVASVDSGTVTIPSGTYYTSAATWTPGQAGTAQLSAQDPRSPIYHYDPDTANVQVVVPTVGLSVTGALGIGQYYDYATVSTPDYMTAATTVTLSHVGTVRAETDSNLTNTPISQVVIPAGGYYGYFRLKGVGTGSGNDSLVASISAPQHDPTTTTIVVGPGRVDPLSNWPSTLKVGDSVQVTLYTRDPQQGIHPVVDSTTFSFTSVANIQFWSGGANSVQISSVIVPAGANSVSFWVKGVTAATGSVTITASNYVSYLATLTVSP